MGLFGFSRKKAEKLYSKNKKFCDERGISIEEIMWDKTKGGWDYPSEIKVYPRSETYHDSKNAHILEARTQTYGYITKVHPDDLRFSNKHYPTPKPKAPPRSA